MRIAFIGEAVSGFGGMETVIRNVIFKMNEDFAEEKCKMFFFCRNDKMDTTWLRDIDYTVSKSSLRLSFLRKRKHISSFSKWLKQTNPDVVICIDVLSCLFAKKARQKSEIDFKIFSWPHFSLDHKKHAQFITCADYHLAISSGIRSQMIARGVAEKDINVIFNPVSKKNKILFPPEPGQPATFIYVGRMKFEGQKRVKDLLKGLSCAKGEWRLHMIGHGSDYEKCRNYGRDLGIDDWITWHGWQNEPWQLVINEIKNVTALLLTSSFEGFPMTLLEAMSYGVPCISSDCMSGPGDMIKPGINGELYPPDNIDHFIKLINQTISGVRKYDNKHIPDTIDEFYIDNYLKDFKKAIFDKNSSGYHD